MHVQHIRAACTFVQVVDILRDQPKAARLSIGIQSGPLIGVQK